MNKAEKALVKETKALIQDMEAGRSEKVGWVAIQDRVGQLCKGHTQVEVGELLGKSRVWVQGVVRWDATRVASPFGGKTAEQKGRGRSEVKRLIQEQPEAVADEIAQAPAESQRKIAEAIVSRPTVEPSLAGTVSKRSPREPKSPERKIGDAVFALWEAGELLMDDVPEGDAVIRMIALAEKAQRLSAGIVHLLDTGSLAAEFKALVEEVGADA